VDPAGSGEPPAVRLPVRSSLFAPSALGAWAAAAYGLPDPVRCRLVSASVNDTYRLDTGSETCCYLRVARHGWRTAGDVEAELRLIEALRERTVSIAPPMARVAGGQFSFLGAPEGPRLAVVFDEAPGENVREIAPTHACAYGRLAARLHDEADAAGGVYPRFHLDLDHLLDGPLAAIRAQLGQHAEPMAELEAVAARVRTRLERLPRRMPDYGVCHGDLHPGNVRFDAKGRPTLFDFDCWGYGWRAYDLAVFLWNSYLERRTKGWRQSRWRAFLRGYREFRPLPQGFDDLVPLFLVARQVWLMGMDCAGSSGWPPQWLDAGWFETMNGFVRRWLEEYPDQLA
jgi:Ser/Thr protein kinase RdoA (MazF antagonist)